MPITYPLSLPTSLGPSQIELRGTHATVISRSPFTYQSQVQAYTGQLWSATVTIPPCPRSIAEDWITFLLSLKGSYGTFLLGDPNGKTPRGTPTGTPLVVGAGQTGSTLNIDGCTNSVTGWLKAGDYIQIGTGSSAQLYKVLTQVNTSGTGTATLDIWPNLRTSPADNAAIITSNCVGKFRLSRNTAEWNIDNRSFYGITFDCEEAL